MFSQDGTRIVTGSRDRTVKVWDARSGTAGLELGEPAAVVASVAFSSDGKRIATAGVDGTVRVWDVLAVVGHLTRTEREDKGRR